MRITLEADREIGENLTFDPPAPRTIGRGAECDLTLTDEAVSRHNTRLDYAASSWYAVDLGSRHGTFLNTVRIDPGEPVVLRDGDFLRVGGTYVRVGIEGAPGVVAPVPDAMAVVTDGPARATIPTAPASSPPDSMATRASIFLRLRDDSTTVREMTWTEFEDRYAPVIRGFARKRGFEAEADDICQEVMLGFFKSLPDFEYDPAKGRFRGYLCTATLHAIWGRVRTRYRDDEKHARHLEQRLSDSAANDWEWERQYLRAQLMRAEELTRPHFEPRTWEAFELYGRRGTPVDIVATDLAMSPESVRKAKANIAKRFRENLLRVQAEE